MSSIAVIICTPKAMTQRERSLLKDLNPTVEKKKGGLMDVKAL